MSGFSLLHVRQQLEAHAPRRIPFARHMKRAAVAAILREGSQGSELLFIRRAEHPKDPWSGHMAFPGGRVDPEDESPRAAALRETREEIGLDLEAASPIADLSHVAAVAHGRKLPLVIYPFAFSIDGVPDLELDRTEVEEVIYVPLSFLADVGNRTSVTREFVGVPVTLPCYHFEGRMIWGLTLKMADEILAALGHRF